MSFDTPLSIVRQTYANDVYLGKHHFECSSSADAEPFIGGEICEFRYASKCDINSMIVTTPSTLPLVATLANCLDTPNTQSYLLTIFNAMFKEDGVVDFSVIGAMTNLSILWDKQGNLYDPKYTLDTGSIEFSSDYLLYGFYYLAYEGYQRSGIDFLKRMVTLCKKHYVWSSSLTSLASYLEEHYATKLTSCKVYSLSERRNRDRVSTLSQM